jgi:hypothetical protein
MPYRFVSIDDFLSSFEVELSNMYYDYDLITHKFDKTVKKVFLYVFIHKLNDLLQDKSVILHFNGKVKENYELAIYYPYDKLNAFIGRVCSSIQQHTNRLITVSSNTVINDNEELDGDVVDQLVLLNNEQYPDLQKLQKFLSKHNLKEMFSTLTKKIV